MKFYQIPKGTKKLIIHQSIPNDRVEEYKALPDGHILPDLPYTIEAVPINNEINLVFESDDCGVEVTGYISPFA
jgi:hypothetical protein